jgi:CDP-glycerol glycerophosphotransferase
MRLSKSYFVQEAFRCCKKILAKQKVLWANIIGFVIGVFDFIYPKDDATIVFGSDGTRRMSGSPRAMFEDMKRNYPDYQVYFITQTPKRKGEILPNTLRTLLIFLRARYAVSSNAPSDFGLFRWSRRKTVIATWHAISLKAVGHAQRGRTKLGRYFLQRYIYSIAAHIASSRFDAAILSLMFGVGDRIFLTGQPRNDHLLDYQSTGKENLKRHLNGISGNETVILYAPTFRDERFGQEGMRVRLFPFEDFDNDYFTRFLSENNIIVLVRMHAADAVTGLEIDNSRVIEFGHNACPDINVVLGDLDFIITDYSSICYDFLLLNRPMMFIPYDLEEYMSKRGLIVDHYDFWTPGPKLSSMKEFYDYVQLYVHGKPDPYEERRIELNKVINSFQTDNSTSRILHVMKVRR